MKKELILINTPFWDMYGPPAATPALAGYLKANGVATMQVDFNQIYFKKNYNNILKESLDDFLNEETFRKKIPIEHKVVIGTTTFNPDLIKEKGILKEDISFSKHRENILIWDTERLNFLDALVHYGYFIKATSHCKDLIKDKSVLDSEFWQDMKQLFLDTCMKTIQDCQPDVIGFSILGEQQLAATIACTQWIKEAYDCKIIWGGSDIRYTHDKMLLEHSWWRELPDSICLGEGESALLKFVRKNQRRSLGDGLKNKFFVETNSDTVYPLPVLTKVQKTETQIAGILDAPFKGSSLPNKHYEKVDLLAPYCFDYLDIHEGYLMPMAIIAYQASRGCHWGICAFCDHEEGYRHHYRPKEIQRVVDHLEYFYEKYGISHFQFVDEAIEPEWFAHLNDELECRNLVGTFRWSNYSKISSKLTESVLKRGYENGCRLILFGVESFNQRLLKLMRKGILRKEVFRTLRATSSAKIKTWIWLISGFPTQTPEELEGDIQDLENISDVTDAISVGRYRISSNSDIFRETENFGIISYDLNSPMEITSQIGGEIVDPAVMGKLYYEKYYPTAIQISKSHNRYLLYAEALREEKDHLLTNNLDKKKVLVSVNNKLNKINGETGLGNI